MRINSFNTTQKKISLIFLILLSLFSCQDDNEILVDEVQVNTLEDVSNIFQECVWKVTSFNNSNHLKGFDLDFEADNSLLITGFGNTITAEWIIVENDEELFVTINNISIVSIQIFSGTWKVVEYEDDRIQMVMNNNIVVIERDCLQLNPFECLESQNLVLTECDESGFPLFNLTELWEICQNSNYNISYFEFLSDAQAENYFNAIPLPSYFVSPIFPSTATIYIRVSSVFDPTIFEIYEAQLIVEYCNDVQCNLQEFESKLLECSWKIINDDSYYGSLNFNFNSNGNVAINGLNEATWSITQTNNDIYLTFDNASANNLQFLNRDWLISECQSDRFRMDGNFYDFIMDQNCN